MSERSFHVLVIAPLHADADHAVGGAFAEPMRFERATFDEAMAAVGPELAIDVPDPARPQKKVRVDLALKAMRAFRPDVMAEQIALVRDLAANAVDAPTAVGGSLVDDILSGMSAPPPAASAIGSIVEHPEVRKLERAWRGLHFLVSRCDRDKVVVDAIHAEADDVADVLARIAKTRDRAPYDLLVVDHTLGASARDLARIAAWAAAAETIGAPLVANGTPELAGEDSLAALGRTQRRLRASDDPRAAALRNVAAKDETRWIALAMNGALARPKHTGAVRRTRVAFDEQGEIFLGAAHLVASLACASFEKTGWACALAGVVRELPVRPIDDRGTAVATPLEGLASEETAVEAAAAGLIVLASVANADVAVLARAPMLNRPPSTSGGTSAAASLGLADQLFVARVAHAVVQLAGAIPRDTPANAACDVARVALAELLGPKLPLDVTIADGALEVTVRPRGFFDVRLEEATLAAPLTS